MLNSSFYSIVQTENKNESFSFLLELNEKHPIYQGHFPGHPVVPGACLLQMVIELIEVIFERKLTFLKADELKFLAPVNPVEDNMLQAQINYSTTEENKINVTAIFSQHSQQSFFKCRAIFSNA